MLTDEEKADLSEAHLEEGYLGGAYLQEADLSRAHLEGAYLNEAHLEDTSLYKAHLEPAAKEIGIVGHFGWHTFRHTYATLLKGNGEDVKVVQELMRHANISVTLNIYAQAITQTK